MIKVVDNFLAFYEELREEAIKADYIDWPGPDGQVYKRISILEPGSYWYEAVKVQLQADLDTEVEMLGMAFRLNYEGEEPNQSIHTDVGWGTHAMVLYLNHGPSNTAFWKHRATDKERLSPNDLMTYVKTKDDWEDVNKWEMVGLVPMWPNRAVIYESELFHSRYPFEAFGSTPEDGRLILVAFFTPKEEK